MKITAAKAVVLPLAALVLAALASAALVLEELRLLPEDATADHRERP